MNARAASANRVATSYSVSPSLQERVGDQAPIGRGELGHGHPQQPGDLEDALLRDAGVAQLAHALRGLDVALGVDGGVVAGGGQPERPPLAPQEVLVDPGPLGDLGGGQTLLTARETRSTGSSTSRSSSTALRSSSSGDPVVGELREQAQAVLARLPLQTLEQPLGLEVDRGHLGAHSAWPRALAS